VARTKARAEAAALADLGATYDAVALAYDD
jgi:hypothetical protein